MGMFGEGFRTPQTPSRNRPHGNLNVLRIAVLLAFGILTVRLAAMQIVNGEEYSRRARENQIRAENILPARGLIFDRNGTELVGNTGSYSATIVPEFLPDEETRREAVYLWLEQHLGVPALETRQRVKEAEDKGASGQEVVVRKQLSMEEALQLEEATSFLQGLRLQITPGRAYRVGEAFAHVLGYTGDQTAEEYAALRKQGYQLNEKVGKAGVESRYETELRGTAGASANEYNAEGRVLTAFKTVDPIPGASLRLSIDAGLQEYTYQLLMDSMKNATGPDATVAAAVVMSPKTGEIYAMVSVPGFDPNIPAQADLRWRDYDALLKDPRLPLLNRTVSAATPGSTFKLITAAAALQEGNITPGTGRTVNNVVLEFKGETGVIFPLYDWATHGYVNLYRAIARSSNHYFYQASCGIPQEGIAGLGNTFDVEEQAVRLASYARMFGLGAATGVDIDAGEADGVLGGPEYKKQTRTTPTDKQWYYADTCFMGIGQLDVQATPLQIAVMTAAMANGGKVLTPHVVKDVVGPDGNVLRTIQTQYKTVKVDAKWLEAVRRGMYESVQTADGAGRRALQPGTDMAGKTGTAEFFLPDGKKAEHAWFTGFAPYTDPEVVVTVYFDLGFGGEKAAPVAGLIAKYFMDKVEP